MLKFPTAVRNCATFWSAEPAGEFLDTPAGQAKVDRNVEMGKSAEISGLSEEQADADHITYDV
jgi:hypothetical protein